MEKTRSRLKEIIRARSIFYGDFTLASGLKSSYYIDCRMTSFDGEGAYLIGKLILEEIKLLAPPVDAVGGPTLGADPIATGVGVVSHLSASPVRIFAVRKKTKDYGSQKMIEGNFRKGDRVVIVEDVITTGGSIFQAIDAVEESGGTIEAVIVVVDRQQGGRENVEKKGYRFISLFTIDELLES